MAVIARALVVAILAGMALSLSAQGSTFYIRAGAAGSGSGADWTNAMPTLPASFQRGATYYIAEGTYSGSRTFNTAVSGTSVITIKRATVADHGTDTGWLDSYGDGYWQLPAQGAFTSIAVNGGGAALAGRWFFASSYWRLDGNTDAIERYGFQLTNTVIQNGMLQVGASGSDAKHVSISDLEIKGTGSQSANGFNLKNTGPFTASNVYVHTINADPFSVSSGDIVIEHCRIRNRVSGFNEHADAVTFNGSFGEWSHSNVTVRYSIIDWEGQIFFFDGTGGTGESNHGTKYIYGNTIYDSKFQSSKCLIVHGNVSSLNGTFELYYINNTCANVATSGVTGIPSNATGEARNNLFFDTPSVGWGGLTRSHNWYKTGMSNCTGGETGVQCGSDPFVNEAAHDYRLASATQPGFSLAAPFTTDLFGLLRGSDGAWDRGAYEFGGVAITPPAAPGNVQILR